MQAHLFQLAEMQAHLSQLAEMQAHLSQLAEMRARNFELAVTRFHGILRCMVTLLQALVHFSSIDLDSWSDA